MNEIIGMNKTQAKEFAKKIIGWINGIENIAEEQYLKIANEIFITKEALYRARKHKESNKREVERIDHNISRLNDINSVFTCKYYNQMSVA